MAPIGSELWLETRELICDPNYDFISSHLSIFFLVSILSGFLFLVPMADKFGRKTLNVSLGLFLVVTLSILCLSKYVDTFYNLTLLTIVICLSLAASAARAIVALIYTSEITTKQNLSRIILFCFVCIALKVILSALHIQYSSMSYYTAVLANLFINMTTLPF